MENKRVNDFNYYETLLFKIMMGFLAATVLFFIFTIIILRQTNAYGNPLAIFNFGLVLLSVGMFLTSVVRIIKYLVKVKTIDENAKIWRSVTTMVLSIVTFAMQFLLLIVIAVSNMT